MPDSYKAESLASFFNKMNQYCGPSDPSLWGRFFHSHPPFIVRQKYMKEHAQILKAAGK